MAGMTLGQAIYYLKGDKSHLSSTLREAENETRRAMSMMQGTGSSTASSIGGFFRDAFAFATGGLISSGIQAIGGSIKGIASEALGAYGDFELLGTSLQTLVARQATQADSTLSMADALAKAGPEAKNLIDWVQKLAVISPFSQDTIAGALRLGMAYNFTTTESQRLTAATVDFAAGSGASADSITGVVTALGQMSATGKVTAGDLNQLTTRGIAAREILADAFGKSTAEIGEMVSKGLIPANQAIEAIVSSLESDFGGAAERAAGTMVGLTTSLGDLKTIGLREFFTGTFQAIQPYLQKFVDTLSDPTVMAKIRELGDSLGRGLGVVLEFFANTLIPGFINAWAEVGPILSEVWGVVADLAGLFTGLANEAYGWGSGIVDQLGQGIMDGAGYVVDALSWLGDQIAYWLQPNSPPKIVPELDEYGKAAAQLYLDSWTAADFDVFARMGQTIEGLLQDLVDTGMLPEQGLIPMMMGAQDEVAAAIEELRTTGTVGEATFRKVRDSAGAAGPALDRMFRSIVNLEKATRATAAAQKALKDIDKKYDDLESPINEEIEALEEKQRLLQEEREIKKLQDVINSHGEEDPTKILEAQYELEAILLRQKLRGIQESRESETSAAEAKLEAAKAEEEAAKLSVARQEKQLGLQRDYNELLAKQIELMSKIAGGGGGGGGGSDSAAKDAERAAQAQWDYQYSIASTDEKMKMLKDRQAGLSEDSEEYWRLQGQMNTVEKERQRELDATAEAQKEYEDSLKTTEEKLNDLYAQRDAAEPGSKEYYELQGQIKDMEEQKTQELEKSKEAQDDLTQAQWDAAYAAADTAGKLQMQRDKLAGLDQSSVEYWQTLTQVRALEAQQKKEAEGAAGALDKKGKSAGGAKKGLDGLISSMKGFKQPASDITKDLGSVATGADDARDRFADMKDRMVDAANNAPPQISPGLQLVKDLIAGIKGVFQEVKDAVGPFFYELQGHFQDEGLKGAIQFIIDKLAGISPIFAVIKGVVEAVWPALVDVITVGVGIVKGFFETTWPEIVQYVQDAWDAIWLIVSGVVASVGSIITTVLGSVKDFLVLHGDEIQNTMRIAWDTIKSIIDVVLALMSGIVEKGLKPIAQWISDHSEAITTVISAAWEGIRNVVDSVLAIIQLAMSGIMTIINGDWQTVWNGLLEFLRIIWDGFWNIVSTVLGSIWGEIVRVWNETTTSWKNAWDAIVLYFSGIWNDLWTSASEKVSEIWDEVVRVWGEVSTAFSTAWDAIKKYWDGIWLGLGTGVTDAVGAIEKFLGEAWGRITLGVSGLFTDIGEGIGTAFDNVVSIMKGIVNGAIDAVNGIIGGINTVSEGLGFGEAVSPIPRLARGTKNWPGGAAVVSETDEGLEYAKIPGVGEGLIMPGVYNLPPGSEITPAGKSAQVGRGDLIGSSGGNTYYVSVAVDARGASDPRAIEEAGERGGYRGAQKAIREFTDSANIRIVTSSKRGS